jgi:hypothetical protein
MNEWIRLKECVFFMNSLLDLRHISNRPLHQDELRELLILTALETLRSVREKDRQPQPQQEREGEGEERSLEEMLPGLVRDVESLLFRITNTLKSESHIWESASMYHTILANGDDPDATNHKFSSKESQEQQSQSEASSVVVGRYERLLKERSRVSLFELRLKQLRSLIQIPNWERDSTQVCPPQHTAQILPIPSFTVEFLLSVVFLFFAFPLVDR